MKTRFPYQKRIDYDAYWNTYMEREDAILPTEAEMKEQARQNIVKDQLVLIPVPEGEAARLGDTVTLAVSSALPRFNKPKVTVSIGRGLYHKGFEESVAGHSEGDRFSVTIQDTPVTVTVLSVRRKAVPEPTDEMVRALGQKDYHNQPICTVADYEAFIQEEQTMQALATVNYYILQLWASWSGKLCAKQCWSRTGLIWRRCPGKRCRHGCTVTALTSSSACATTGIR